MTKILRLGPITITVLDSKPYSKVETLEECAEEGYEIVRKETEDTKTPAIKYSLMQGDSELVFIRGYLESPTRFHVMRIENSTGDNISGFRYLPSVFKAMEQDLKGKGVEYLTTSSLAKIAHIAVGRYGFEDMWGRSYEELKNHWLRNVPFKAVPLEKRL